MTTIRSAILEFWATLAAMSPYLLFGFAVAGVMSVLISPEQVRRHLGGSGIWQVLKASAFGVPLPLCSCSVIPVAMSLHLNGASKAATVAFLLSTPQTGLDSIMVTLGLLGPVFAIVRPITALLTGLVGGLLAGAWDRPGITAKDGSCCCHQVQDDRPASKILSTLRYGFIRLPQDIGRPLIIGVIIAACISVLIPDDFFAAHLGRGILPMLVMMAVGIPLYVCATASVPMAAAMILKGLSPGAALVFLMTGPATNAAGLTTIWRSLGAKAAVAYLLAVGVCSIASALLLDWLVVRVNLPLVHRWHWMLGAWIENISAVVLIAVIVTAEVQALIRRQTVGR